MLMLIYVYHQLHSDSCSYLGNFLLTRLNCVYITLLLTIVNVRNHILILYWDPDSAVHNVKCDDPNNLQSSANHILHQQRSLYHSNRIAATASYYRLEIVLRSLKNYLRIIICQHGIYLEDKIAGSSYDGFRYVIRDFKWEICTYRHDSDDWCYTWSPLHEPWTVCVWAWMCTK